MPLSERNSIRKVSDCKEVVRKSDHDCPAESFDKDERRARQNRDASHISTERMHVRVNPRETWYD